MSVDGTLAGLALVGRHGLESLSCLAQTRVVYQWLRLERMDQWWHWPALLVTAIALAAFVVYWYRRDTREQSRGLRWALLLLRLAALGGLLLFFFQLDKRREQRVVRDSRAAVLVDTSLSMSLPGTPQASGAASQRTRAEEAASILDDGELTRQLAERHEVTVYRFDQLAQPMALGALAKQAADSMGALDDGRSAEAGDEGALDSEESARRDAALETRRGWVVAALVVGAVALALVTLALGAQLVAARPWPTGGWLFLAGSLLILVALAMGGWAIVPATQFPVASLLGVPLPEIDVQPVADRELERPEPMTLPPDWLEVLRPEGAETHLGDAIKSILDRELGNPLAGVVLLTDGRGNAGIDSRQVVATAQSMRVPLFIVGLGSERHPPNLQLVELDAPKRLYPGDRFSLNVLTGAQGYAGREVTVRILAGAQDAELDGMAIEEERQVTMPADGSIMSVPFELDPKAVGEWRYAARILEQPGEADTRDNVKTAQIEVIERKNRVLVVAGGPTREYQFVRNLLYRDRDVESHVMLQTGTELTSQEAQELLTEFPADRAALAQYDAVLAFDVDWTEIPERSVDALEQWVAEQAGGFLIVAGSVEMPKWVSRSASGTRARHLRSLSPVVLEQRGSSLLAAGRVESAVPWPLTITPEGQQTDFMWLSDDARTNGELWDAFDGVHSFYSAYELKPGAKALALFSDPTASVDGQQPIYMASQFYGAGRVVFLGAFDASRINTSIASTPSSCVGSRRGGY